MPKKRTKEEKRQLLRVCLKKVGTTRALSEMMGLHRDTVKKWSCGAIEMPDSRVDHMLLLMNSKGIELKPETDAERHPDGCN